MRTTKVRNTITTSRLHISIAVLVFSVFAVGLLVFVKAALPAAHSFEAELGTTAGATATLSESGTSGAGGVTLNASTNNSNIYKGAANTPYIPYSTDPQATDNGIFELFAESGIHALRIGLPWNETQPTAKGVWNEDIMRQADYYIQRVTDMGIKVLVVAVGSPPWASGGGAVNSPNFKDADYADYMEQLIERYPGKIEAIEVWNEPSYSGFLQNSDPARYTSLLKAAYTRIKQVDANIIVVGGSLYGSVYNNPDFLRGMYENGAKDYFDVLATHEYGDTPERAQVWGASAPPASYTPLFNSIKNNLVSIMVEFGDGNKPIWLTETGANTAGGGKGVSPDQQAQALNDAFAHLKSGAIPQMKRIYWYNFANGWTEGAEEHRNNPEWNYGIVTPRTPFPELSDWTRKPAFAAFKAQ